VINSNNQRQSSSLASTNTSSNINNINLFKYSIVTIEDLQTIFEKSPQRLFSQVLGEWGRHGVFELMAAVEIQCIKIDTTEPIVESEQPTQFSSIYRVG
jgi:hypothetical protein